MFKGGTLQEGEIILGDTGPATAGGCKDRMGAQYAKLSVLLNNTHLLQGKSLKQSICLSELLI